MTKVKVCGKKYLVHDHHRFRSRFCLKAPGLMVNVSRVQVPCVIGVIFIINMFEYLSSRSGNRTILYYIFLYRFQQLKLSSCQTATGSCIREKMNTITEEQFVSWNRNSMSCIFDSNTLRQQTWTMDLNPIVKYEDS